MSQKIEDKTDAAEARTHETRGFMQQVRVASRRKYTPEEKVFPRGLDISRKDRSGRKCFVNSICYQSDYRRIRKNPIA